MTNTAETLTADQSVAAYLAEQRIDYTAALVGETNRDGWICDEWRVTLTKRAAPAEYTPNKPGKALASMDTRYFTGTGHRAKPRKRMSWDNSPRPVAPTAASVLYSLLLDAQGAEQPFGYWAADYGYDTDSIKALGIYNACCEIRRDLYKLLSNEQRETLRTMLEGY